MKNIKQKVTILALCLLSMPALLLGAQKNDTKTVKPPKHHVESPAYLIYNNDGNIVSYGAMIKSLMKNDVIFLGEYHNSSLVHWLEREVVESFARVFNNKITVGMEMLEADNQLIIDEYMADLISESRFLAEAYLWPNYKMDYAPILEFAKEKKIKMVATNVPRRYAGALMKMGAAGLRENFSKESQQYYIDVLDRVDSIDTVDPLFVKVTSPVAGIDSKKEGKMGKMVMNDGENSKKESRSLMMYKAQSLKDAVMAHNIAKNLSDGTPFIHINGNFHSVYDIGIITFLKEKKPNVKIGTVTTVYQDEMFTFDNKNKGKADFYFVLPSNTHKTY